MTAIRAASAAEGQFVMLTNAAGQDKRLSLQARGIIYYVLSLPPDTPLSAEFIESTVPNGRVAVRSALRELEKFGYYRKTRSSLGRGKWKWEQVLSDKQLASGHPAESPQVSSSDRFTSDVSSSDVTSPDDEESDKNLKTEPPKTKDLRRTERAGQPALFGDTPPAPKPRQTPTPASRAQLLTKRYVEAVPMSSFPAVLQIVKKAIAVGQWPDDVIEEALMALAAEDRTVTINTLRVALNGQEPPQSWLPPTHSSSPTTSKPSAGCSPR